MKLFNFLWFYLFIIMMLVSCVPQPTIRETIETRAPNTSIVFGKVTLTSSMPNVNINTVFHDRPLLIIQNLNSGKIFSFDFISDQLFFWELESGDYNVLGFACRARRFEIPVRMKFTVPTGINNVYIGDINLNLIDKRYSCSIKNEIDNTYADFQKKLIKYNEKPVVSILKMDDSIGNFSKIKGVCAPDWGIRCDDDFFGMKIFGVAPVKPKLSTTQFPQIDTKKPIFEWEKSKNDNITYDLVIYEAALYELNENQYFEIPGRIIVYEENITGTKYLLKDELNNNSKYYWSVRARNKDTVSSWSNFYYFYFMVVASFSGSNQMFSFSTP